ncbi:hypothetical protein MFU01_85190 [Myxococcus fulvus]|nr:hypothetical protein MFU01_85190 [Myxococcus fulvus]
MDSLMPTNMNSRISILIMAVACVSAQAFAATLSSASSTAFTFPNGTFEIPALAASPGYQYAPAGSGSTYPRFTTGPVLLGSGAHTVAVHGTHPQGTDSTAFVDDLTVTRRW